MGGSLILDPSRASPANAGLGPYGASRGGIRQLTMSLADDWGKFGITVNCLAPGWFCTEQNKVLYQNKEWVEYLCDRIPVKRPGELRDLDAALVFLAAESSRYVTGQTLLVDGGILHRCDQGTGGTKITAFAVSGWWLQRRRSGKVRGVPANQGISQRGRPLPVVGGKLPGHLVSRRPTRRYRSAILGQWRREMCSAASESDTSDTVFMVNTGR